MTKFQESQAASVSRTEELRQHARRKLAGMAYVELAQDNGGILLNLSEGGLAVQSALALSTREFPELRFQLPNMRGWLTAAGRVAWMSDSKKEAGIQFLDLHEHARAQIRMWVDNDGMGEPESVVAEGVGAQHEVLTTGQTSHGEGANGAHGSLRTARAGAKGRTEQTAETFASHPRHAETPPAEEDRNFRFHDYSMFAGDAGVPWVEPTKQKRSWGRYVLFTMLLAALFFVLGAMIGRDNLNALVSSVEGWKEIKGQAPPNVKPPAAPEVGEAHAPPASEAPSADARGVAGEEPSGESNQIVSRGDKAAQNPSVTPEQNAPLESPTEKSSADSGAANAASEPAEAKRDSSAASVATPREGGTSTNKNGRVGRRETSYGNAEADAPGDSGRLILVNAPAPGSPPFFVNLPAEAVSASSSVAISARRSIQVPPQSDGSGNGSERVIIGKLIAHSDPFYPVEARNKRLEGIVELHALVGRSGLVIRVTPVSGPAVLAAAGVTALHEWRYEPTFINGDPVETHVDVTMVFRSP